MSNELLSIELKSPFIDFTEIFSEKTIENIYKKINEVEKGAQVRLINKEHIKEIINIIEKFPAGHAMANGGHVSKSYRNKAKTTYFTIYWYTFRKEKKVGYSIIRGPAKHIPFGSEETYECDITKNGREEAYKELFPVRYKKYKITKGKLILKHNNIIIPEEEIDEIGDIDKKFKLATVKTKRKNYYLCTPEGLIKIDYLHTVKRAYEVITNKQLPRSKKANWETIEPEIITALLIN
jgi:hypothetical protein